MADLLREFFDIHSVGVFFLFAGMISVFTLIISAIDLGTGVRKAKKEGVYRTSRKLRRTVEKLTNYFSFLFMLLIADAVLHTAFRLLGITWFANAVPILMGLMFLYILYIEIKSVIENTTNVKDKDTLKGAAALLEEMIKQYGPDAISKLLRSAGRSKCKDYDEYDYRGRQDRDWDDDMIDP